MLRSFSRKMINNKRAHYRSVVKVSQISDITPGKETDMSINCVYGNIVSCTLYFHKSVSTLVGNENKQSILCHGLRMFIIAYIWVYAYVYM